MLLEDTLQPFVVLIHGLSERKELNEQAGACEGQCPGGRYLVRLPCGQLVGVRPDCARCVGDREAVLGLFGIDTEISRVTESMAWAVKRAALRHHPDHKAPGLSSCAFMFYQQLRGAFLK